MLELNHWLWGILGLIFICIEIFVITIAVFLWMGISSFILAIIVFFHPNLSWDIQLLIFTPLAILSAIFGRYLLSKNNVDNQLNSRANSYIGNTYVIYQLKPNVDMKIKIEDTLWLAKFEDISCNAKVGDKVEVIDAQSTTLIVRKI